MNSLKEYNGEVLNPGDIILYPSQGDLEQGILLNPVNGKVSVFKTVNLTNHWGKIYTERWSLQAKDVNNHNGFVYVWDRKCIKIGRVDNFNPRDYKSNTQLIKEAELNNK